MLSARKATPTGYLLGSILLHACLDPGTRASRHLVELLLGQLGHLEGPVLRRDMPALLEPRPLKQCIKPLLEVGKFVDIDT